MIFFFQSRRILFRKGTLKNHFSRCFKEFSMQVNRFHCNTVLPKSLAGINAVGIKYYSSAVNGRGRSSKIGRGSSKLCIFYKWGDRKGGGGVKLLSYNSVPQRGIFPISKERWYSWYSLFYLRLFNIDQHVFGASLISFHSSPSFTRWLYLTLRIKLGLYSTIQHLALHRNQYHKSKSL